VEYTLHPRMSFAFGTPVRLSQGNSSALPADK
jgi:hypothetical protein